MPIVSGKTPNGLVLHAQKALKEKWWYVWGTFGNVLTQSLLNSKATQYPAYNGGAYKAVHQRHIGETVSDCVGLLKDIACGMMQQTSLYTVQILTITQV